MLRLRKKKSPSNLQRQLGNVKYFTVLIPLYYVLENFANMLIDLYDSFPFYLKIDQN
jgi:hypothetical protein